MPNSPLVRNFVNKNLQAALERGRKPIDINASRLLLDINSDIGRLQITPEEARKNLQWLEANHKANLQEKDAKTMIEALLLKTGCPFNAEAINVLVNLLTDSGTSQLTPRQEAFKKQWQSLVADEYTVAYNRPATRDPLDFVFQTMLGEQFDFYLTPQCRGAEFVGLKSLLANGVIEAEDWVLTNHPFDTTKGHILLALLNIAICGENITPERYEKDPDGFHGNINMEKLAENYEKSGGRSKIILATVTDNADGGQPVSMENLRKVSEFARPRGLLVWLDSCRIFENAMLIKLHEPGYQDKTVHEIAKEMASYADFGTISFKKIYSHEGGGFFVNRNSELLAGKIEAMGRSLQEYITIYFGCGFKSYSGKSGMAMVEMMSGLFEAVDPEILMKRIGQVKGAYKAVHRHSNSWLPGAHALYAAADKILYNVPRENCRAETFQMVNFAALGMLGCALGDRLNGKWEKDGQLWTLKVPASADWMRYAFPRERYIGAKLALIEIVGIAEKEGVYSQIKDGFEALDFNPFGFWHFGSRFKAISPAEIQKAILWIYDIAVAYLKERMG